MRPNSKRMRMIMSSRTSDRKDSTPRDCCAAGFSVRLMSLVGQSLLSHDGLKSCDVRCWSDSCRKIAGPRMQRSAKSCHMRCSKPSYRLFNPLIGGDEQGPRDHEAERLGGLEVDHQLELRRLPYGKLSWLGTLQNLVHIARRPPKQVVIIRRIGDQSAGLDVLAEGSRRPCRPMQYSRV